MADLVPHVAGEYAIWYYANLTAPPDEDPFAAAAIAAPPCPSDYDAAVDYLERYAARAFATEPPRLILTRPSGPTPTQHPLASGCA